VIIFISTRQKRPQKNATQRCCGLPDTDRLANVLAGKSGTLTGSMFTPDFRFLVNNNMRQREVVITKVGCLAPTILSN
jgi:hypothetical protein